MKLENYEAVNLWKKSLNEGHNYWNDWVEKNPICDVDLSGIDFKYLKKYVPEGQISFKNFKFPNGKKNFEESNFGDGLINFSYTDFGEGEVNFVRTEFGNGDILFVGATASKGHIYFRRAKFGMGSCDFSFGALKGGGSVVFSYAKFEGDVKITSLEKDWEKEFFFKGATFEGPLEILDSSFIGIPDFTYTQFNSHIALSGIRYNLKQDVIVKTRLFHNYKLNIKQKLQTLLGLSQKLPDRLIREYSARLQRLKELAALSKYHEFAIACHGDELRINRWYKKSTLASLLDLFFSAASNYGQSISRPLLLLIFF